MKRVHPNLSHSAIGAAIALSIAVGGCKSTSSGVGSPFLAPDRVPPPSTRVLMPGQAQPYYPGDPMPVMQSATGPTPSAVAADPREAETLSANGRTLAWAAPGSSPPPAVAPPQPQSGAPINEGLVAVPSDADPLRFALPSVADLPIVEPIPSAPVVSNNQPAPRSPVQPPPNVQLASYNAPVPSAPPAPVNVPIMTPPQLVASPWRSPQIARPPSSSTLPAPPMSPPVQVPQPVSAPVNSMGVRLQPVASPPQPGDPMPRVRIPVYVGQQISAADGFRPRTSMQ